ncbi:uncharacterized protein LOC108916534, partial [Anoplophora glabripennis]|uniref:uncharacterized protein LOC108916534 n=1 Tax=Anoplophora glabripennis TaxID=217634 RepID=UPI000C75E22E
MVRERQRDAWRAYCEEIGDYSQAARLCKILAKEKDHDIDLLTREDGRRLIKAYISYEQCRRTVGKTWGMKPNVVMWIYTAIVRPMLAYGAVVWWPKSQQTTAKQKLSQVQRVACLSLTGATRTTPTIAMEVMLCLPPLDIYLREMALTTMLRLENVGLKPVVGCGEVRSRLWNEVVRKTPLLQADTDSISPRFAFDKPYTVLIKRQEETARGDVISIFTDRSKRKKGAGCGIYSRSLHIRYQWAMDRHATVVQTELAGITIAAKEIARWHTGTTIRIYTDSRQALLTLRNHKIMTRTVWECYEALVVASAANSISVYW